jgi:hypothetical protein
MIRIIRCPEKSSASLRFLPQRANERGIPQPLAGTGLTDSFHFVNNLPPDNPHTAPRAATRLLPNSCNQSAAAVAING